MSTRGKRPSKVGMRADETCVTHVSDDAEQVEVAITNPMTLINLAKVDPIAAAQEGQAAATTLEAWSSQYKIELIGTSYASAHYMNQNGDWHKFVKDIGWGDLPKPKATFAQRKRILYHVMRYIFRAKTPKDLNRVGVYANMLIDNFNKGFPPDKVVPLIKEFGVEGLRVKGETERRLRKNPPVNSYFKNLSQIGQDDIPPSEPNFWRVRFPPPHGLKPPQIKRVSAAIDRFRADFMRYLLRES